MAHDMGPVSYTHLDVYKRQTDTEVEDGVYATLIKVVYTDHGMEKTFEGVGNGPIAAVQRGLEKELGINIKVLDYNEHALRSGSNAQMCIRDSFYSGSGKNAV